MKKVLLAATFAMVLTSVSGFTIKNNSAVKEDPGPAWINCDLGYLHTCFEDTYYVMDGEPGDTYEWWLDADSGPDTYLGSGPSVNVELGYKHVLILRVNSVYYGQYDYYDTAWGCFE